MSEAGGMLSRDEMVRRLFGEYDEITPVSDTVFLVHKSGKHSSSAVFSTEIGTFVIPPMSGYVDILSGPLVRVVQGGTDAVYSVERNEFVIPIGEYDSVEYLQYSDELLLVSRDKKTGVYSIKNSAIVVPIEFSRVMRITDVFFEVLTDGEMWGVYSTMSASLVVPAQFRADITRLTDTLFLVKADSGLGVYSTMSASLVVPTEYNHIERFTDTLFQVMRVSRHVSRSFWGLYSTHNNEVQWKP